MKYLNTYNNEAAYLADTNRPLDAATVSKVAEILKYEGQNIVMPKEYATVGDTFVFDKTDLQHKVVKLGTLNIATLGSNYVVGGTVERRESRMIYLDGNVNLGNFQWGAPYKVKAYGFDLVTGGSFTVTINTSTTATITYTTSDTLSTIASKMQDAIRAIMTIATWTVTAYAGYVVVQQNSYSPNVTVFTVNDGDSKIVREILTGNYQTATTPLIPTYGFVRRRDGVQTSFAGSNLEKFISYYSTSGSDLTGQEVGASSVINESRFNEVDNPLLVAYYGTYRNYMADKCVRSPYTKGAITDNKGKLNTYTLAAETYIDHDGTTQPAHPAHYAASQYGITTEGYVTGFEQGNWYLDGFQEKFLTMRDITYGLSGITTSNMDAVNKGIFAATGVTTHLISVNASQWTSMQYSGYNAWLYYGPRGIMTAYLKYHSNSVRATLAFQL